MSKFVNNNIINFHIWAFRLVANFLFKSMLEKKKIIIEINKPMFIKKISLKKFFFFFLQLCSNYVLKKEL